MVGYDSIIPPGREGSIRPKVNLKGYHSGKFSKSITVSSNATNSPSLRLKISGTVKPIIGVSTRMLRLTNKAAEPVNVTLKTEKKDLKIKKMFLRTKSGGKPSWQVNLPHYLDYDLVNAEQPNSEGYYEHSLNIWAKLDLDRDAFGDVIIKTNHPEKQEISLRGRISKARN